MYKCCWNCINGFTVDIKSEEERKRIDASKRMCWADYPVSNRLQNPFQQRYCKQFEEDYSPKSEREVHTTRDTGVPSGTGKVIPYTQSRWQQRQFTGREKTWRFSGGSWWTDLDASEMP